MSTAQPKPPPRTQTPSTTLAPNMRDLMEIIRDLQARVAKLESKR